ncbi:MAG: DinB family protein [Gemmatimonadetes bacterium]|nr:DinB family protein [Gemmatimonadota bacterium]
MNATPVTPDQLLQRLEVTEAEVIATLGALSDAQWSWAPDDATWSAAHIVEHIGAVERGMAKIYDERFDTLEPSPFSDEQRAKRDAMLAKAVPNRDIKIEAPAGVRPKNRFATRAEAMAALATARKAFMTVVRTRGDTLRSRLCPHPAFGNIDGIQWGIVIAEHGLRHMAQLAELRTRPGFPAA